MTIGNWLSVDKTSGTGDDTITLIAKTNEEIEERLASITIKTKTKKSVVSITQNANLDKKYFWVEFEDEGGVITMKDRYYSYLPFNVNITYSFNGDDWYNMSGDTISMGDNKKVYIYNKSRYLGKANDSLYGKRFLFSQNCNIGGIATALSEMNYYGFNRCFEYNPYLIDASQLILPWEELEVGCFYSMFTNCPNLIGAPQLPATTLAKNCYSDMFSKCSSLTKSPDLLATDLVENCYFLMFAGCSNLSSIRMLGYNLVGVDVYGDPITWESVLGGWVWKYSLDEIGNAGQDLPDGFGVAPEGVFYTHHNNIDKIPLNSLNGVPMGWSVEVDLENVVYYETSDNQIFSVNFSETNVYSEDLGCGYMTLQEQYYNLPRGAFNSNRITKLTLPNVVIGLQNDTIKEAPLTEFVIPDSVTSITSLALYHNPKTIKKLTIGGGMTKFEDCWGNGQLNNVEELIIREGVEEISWGVDEFNSVTKVVFPKSLKVIGSHCFNGSKNLNLYECLTDDLNITTIGDYAFKKTTAAGQVIRLPQTLTTIGNYAFYEVKDLTQIIIPQSVTTIGNYAFADTDLNTIVCEAITAPTITSSTLSLIPNNGTLYVPQGADYSSWSNNLPTGWTIQEIS